ncbi:rCG53548, isoform CRA_a [Rattus norvegicus]|uniref:RCG53548, isoform CRA_a n=1 Tax=Rattus norvegicus TaxID=10116 RepID=A6JB53_RAT|nr:rCG53548, isoform CRA_a [Rattus norvegicus]
MWPPSISPGNIWTPLWQELAAATSDPRATILEGTLAQLQPQHLRLSIHLRFIHHS